jgi:hypothetical protein
LLLLLLLKLLLASRPRGAGPMPHGTTADAGREDILSRSAACASTLWVGGMLLSSGEMRVREEK